MSDIVNGENRSQGFSIPELIIVIVTISILVSITYFGLGTVLPSSRDSERDQDVFTIADRIEQYYKTQPVAGGYTYPDTATGVAGLTTIVNSNESIVAPGQSGTSLSIASSNAAQTPTKDQYIYQPLTRTGTLCTNATTALCARYILYYRREVSNSIVIVNSQEQQ